MAIIWGLDLKEMQWGKFKNKYMWCDAYHLRRTKFIVYQLAMILCVVSESLGTDALSSYVDEQKAVIHESDAIGDPANVYNDDIVGSFSYNIFVGVFIATIFGAAFFFDLFWPERRESRAVRMAWKATSVLAAIFCLSSALVLTIVLATHEAYIEGNTPEGLQLTPPLSYRKNGEAIASVVLIWLGFPATCASAWLMWRSIDHNSKYGPVAAHLRNSKEYESHPYLARGDPSSASNGAGAAGSSALEQNPHLSSYRDHNGVGTTNGTNGINGGTELHEKPNHHTGGGLNHHHNNDLEAAAPLPSTYQSADNGAATRVPEPYTVPSHSTGPYTTVTGPHTTVSGPTTTTTSTTTTTF